DLAAGRDLGGRRFAASHDLNPEEVVAKPRGALVAGALQALTGANGQGEIDLRHGHEAAGGDTEELGGRDAGDHAWLAVDVDGLAYRGGVEPEGAVPEAVADDGGGDAVRGIVIIGEGAAENGHDAQRLKV